MITFKNLSATVVAGATSLSLAPVAFAQSSPFPGGISKPEAGFSDFGDLITRGLNLIFIIAALAVLIYLFIGAFTYLTAGDSEDNVAKARKQITNAIVGLIILASAWAVWQFIVSVIPGLSELLD